MRVTARKWLESLKTKGVRGEKHPLHIKSNNCFDLVLTSPQTKFGDGKYHGKAGKLEHGENEVLRDGHPGRSRSAHASPNSAAEVPGVGLRCPPVMLNIAAGRLRGPRWWPWRADGGTGPAPSRSKAHARRLEPDTEGVGAGLRDGHMVGGIDIAEGEALPRALNRAPSIAPVASSGRPARQPVNGRRCGGEQRGVLALRHWSRLLPAALLSQPMQKRGSAPAPGAVTGAPASHPFGPPERTHPPVTLQAREPPGEGAGWQRPG